MENTFCPQSGTVYKDLVGVICPQHEHTEYLQRFEAAAVPIVTDLFSRGFVVSDIHIGTAFQQNPRIEITFADFYHFTELPDGFEIESQYTHDNAPPNTPTKIARRFSPDLSAHKLYREWLRALSDIIKWTLALPLPVKRE